MSALDRFLRSNPGARLLSNGDQGAPPSPELPAETWAARVREEGLCDAVTSGDGTRREHYCRSVGYEIGPNRRCGEHWPQPPPE